MSRELQARAVLAADQFGLLALHRHVASCPRCGPALLVGDGRTCDRGRRLLDACRSWRDRSRA